MRLVHYSTTPDLKETDPSKIGTSGVKGNAFRQGKPKIGATYFYKEGTESEDVVRAAAKHKYVTSIPDDQIVDLSNDPKDTYNKALDAAGGSFWHHQDFHQAILDNGYSGYFNSESGLPNAVALLKPQPVKYIGKDPKGHKNTSFGDEHFAEFEKDWPKAGDKSTKPAVTAEEIVNTIVDRLLS